jgi:hypothetical protein
VNYLRWLWREQRSVARALCAAVGILLIGASGLTASDVAARSTVRLAHSQRPAVFHLDAGAYAVSQDIGDRDFPDDSSALTISGPSGLVPVQTVPQDLTPADAAGLLLGAWDCYQVMSFTIPVASNYQVTIRDRSGMSAAWISEPYTDVAWQVLPWLIAVIAALLAIALCLIIPLPRRCRIR